MNIQRMADRIAGYRDDVWMVIVGDYGCISSLRKIIDSINTNGCSGHSFSIKINDREKDILTAGSFDGDGAAYIQWIASGVEGNNMSLDMMNFPEETKTYGFDSGDSILIVKGTREGIESIDEIVKNILNYVSTSKSDAKVLTDDVPPVECGIYYFDEEDGDGFGFKAVFDKQTIFDNPIEVISRLGCELKFFKR